MSDEWRRRCSEFVRSLRNVTKLFQLVTTLPNKVEFSAALVFFLFCCINLLPAAVENVWIVGYNWVLFQ